MPRPTRLLLWIFVAVAGLALAYGNRGSIADVAASQADDAKPTPVEDDMHEFMEYVFQPTYLRLKQAMTREPADNNGWKAIKSDALILAEGGNLLLLRPSHDDAKAWNAASAEVRDLGGKLYAAAKKKDYRAARTSYEAMLKNCNQCHTKFADGEHQLTP